MGPDGTWLAVSASANGVYRYDRGTDAWKVVLFAHIGGPYSVQADLRTPGRFYICVVGDDSAAVSTSGGLHRTDDDGATWTQVLPDSVHSLAIDCAVT